MKKALEISPLLLLVLMAICVGCQPVESDSDRVAVRGPQYSAPSAWRDPETGCEYLIQQDTGLTPRLDRNGSPMCPGVGL